MRTLLILVFTCAAAGCAVNNVYDYRTAPLVLPVQGEHAVSLSVTDERPYVLNGKKPASFIGLRRGGYGNPFNVTTTSGEPLAQDMTVALSAALQNAGYTVAGGEKASRLLTITLREWKSDVYSNLKLIFDLTLTVLSADGTELASKTLQGEEAIGGGAMMAQHNEAVRQAFELKMSQLFSDPQIKGALTGG